MKGWTIFVHSVRMVVDNLEDALRVSGLLYLMHFACQMYLQFSVSFDPETDTVPELPGMAFFAALGMLVSLLWLTVAWHRHVLRGATLSGWLPRWEGSRMLGYLGRSLMIMILIALCLAAALVPFGLVAMQVPAVGSMFVVLSSGIFFYMLFRLGVMLPAGTVDKPLNLSDSWNVMRGEGGTIVYLVVIYMLANLLVELPYRFSPNPGLTVQIVYDAVTSWFMTMIGISLLTTLYGHYVEDRPID